MLFWQDKIWAFGVADLPFYDDVHHLHIHFSLVVAAQIVTAFGFYRRTDRSPGAVPMLHRPDAEQREAGICTFPWARCGNRLRAVPPCACRRFFSLLAAKEDVWSMRSGDNPRLRARSIAYIGGSPPQRRWNLSSDMASPIFPPLFLATPGDPPIPWSDWKLIFQAYADAAGEDANKPERRKALLFNALGHAGLKLLYTLNAANASASTPASDVFQDAVALCYERHKDASYEYIARCIGEGKSSLRLWQAVACNNRQRQ
ncbi:hypothetical protein HPB52_006533 [Rhipicephalus sanguineus]|uniref:Uncharacterized protein n=1 Tax=Rhipicephalus sanguineus TaxID=34632 RepID=A0A9D4PK94_RHISA|nr:hypothetical protein HPB52_006533 [Rhipicephalus sanguineus]